MKRVVVKKEGLHVTEMEGEILIYDRESGKAHYLNPMTSRVWRLIDGDRNVAEIISLLEQDQEVQGAELVVQLALEQLHRRKLLGAGVVPPAGPERQSRRDILKKIAAFAALPAIMTMTAQPAWSQLSFNCTDDSQCAIFGTFQLCKQVGCVQGRCNQTGNKPDGTVVANLTPCSDSVCQAGAATVRIKPDGTPCGPNMVCMNGSCVTQDNGQLPPDNPPEGDA